MSKENIVKQAHEGLYVVIEVGQKDCRPADVSLELLSKGRSLADEIGTSVTAILVGQGVSPVAEDLIYSGADQVIIVDDPIAKDYRTEVYTDIIVEQVEMNRQEILLVGATCIGRDLAPRLAGRLSTGCTSDCTELAIDKATRLIVGTKPFLGRNVMTDIICPHCRPQIVTVRPGVMESKDPDRQRKGELIHVKTTLKEKDVKVKVLETVMSKATGASLEKADKVVAGGLGMGDAAGFEMLQELADLLGAQVGATSLPIDAGWVPEDYKIGQTGKTIRPRLYIGCGISGAVQHSAGIINSEVIVAINSNPKAEIFDFADYGIIGDVNKIIPALIRELNRWADLSNTCN